MTDPTPVLSHAARRALEFYAARIPYHRGKARIVDCVLRTTHLEPMDRARILEVERAGVRWRLDIRCELQRGLYYYGALEAHDTRALLDRIPRGGVFADIGSYFGYYALLAARHGARVFAFEPVAANYELLLANRSLNHASNLEVFRLAMSDAVGRASFALPHAGNRGTGHLLDAAGESGTEQVEATTLDRFVREHRIDRIDAVKIDVEGAEVRVLAGGSDTLARFKPALLIELNPPCLARLGASEEALLAALGRLGYCVYRPTHRGLAEFSGLAAGEEYANIFCVPR